MDANPISQVTLASIAVWIIEKAKSSSRLPWLGQGTDNLNRFIAVLIALTTAAGITWSFYPDTGTLTVEGLTLQNMLRLLWLAVQQLACQEVIYRTAVKKRPSSTHQGT